jgi:hypothetical protein
MAPPPPNVVSRLFASLPDQYVAPLFPHTGSFGYCECGALNGSSLKIGAFRRGAATT